MKVIAKIMGITADEVGDATFAGLVRIYPEGAPRHMFNCVLPVDDQRVVKILELLDYQGFRPWQDRYRPMDCSKEFWLHFDRQYDLLDLVACEFLELAPPSEACNPGATDRDDRHRWMGVPEINMPEDQFDIYFGRPHWYFVPSAVKEQLDAGGFHELNFRPTYFIPRDLTVDDTDDTIRARHGMPYWELHSDRTLPPLAPSMQLVDHDGNGIKDHDFSHSIRAVDGLYIHPELHYRRSDLEKIEPFDLARTFEPLGGLTDWSRLDGPLVASQRFYQCCLRSGIKTGWVPVRIDPE